MSLRQKQQRRRDKDWNDTNPHAACDEDAAVASEALGREPPSASRFTQVLRSLHGHLALVALSSMPMPRSSGVHVRMYIRSI